MPNRLIHESARFSKSLASLSHGAERMFWRLTTVADDFGRFNAESSAIVATCFPLMIREITDKQVEGWLEELGAAQLVRIYVVAGSRFGCFQTWDKYQQQRAKKSKFPEPPASDSTCEHLQSNVSDSNEPRSDSNTNTNTFSNTEGESEGEPFACFYAAYPRHMAPENARKAWKKLNPGAELIARIMADFPRRYAHTEKDYIPYPASYLNGKFWEGEIEARAAPTNRFGNSGMANLARHLQEGYDTRRNGAIVDVNQGELVQAAGGRSHDRDVEGNPRR